MNSGCHALLMACGRGEGVGIRAHVVIEEKKCFPLPANPLLLPSMAARDAPLPLKYPRPPSVSGTQEWNTIAATLSAHHPQWALKVDPSF